MLGQQPVKAVGWNLGLRLYLLLVAIFLPTFLSYYVYTIRTSRPSMRARWRTSSG
jgi:hypothetical protein